MRLQASEVLNEAIMTKTPCVIIEGKYDQSIYEGIAASAGKKVTVLPVELIDGRGPGNAHVIQAIEDIEAIPTSRSLSDHILGIIDRDTREYRDELPASTNILVLEGYSIESHYVSKESVVHAINFLTPIPASKLTSETVTFVYEQFTNHVGDLFLVSLEALKGACDATYSASVGFSDNAPYKNLPIVQGIRQKEAELLKFSSQFGLTSCITDLKKCVKGKWLLQFFAEFLARESTQLSNHCRYNRISNCTFCSIGIPEKCDYRTHFTPNAIHITSYLRSKFDFAEFEYIRRRIRAMA